MKNMLKKLYILFIFAVLCVPVGFMGIYKADNNENRALAEMPTTFSERFAAEFENYIGDRFAFRDILVNADGKIKYDIFGLSGNKKIAAGKDGWLFYAETIDDVISKNVMTDREIFCVARTLELANDYARKNGAKFIFMPAPNKASLYGEYLPYYYKKSDAPNNLAKITSLIKNVDYIDLKPVFASQAEPLYHKLDSHWNNKGASLAANKLLERLNLEKNVYSEPAPKQDWTGDLYKMLFPLGKEKDVQYYYDENEFHYKFAKRFKGVDDMTILTENALSQNGSVLLFRDSFGRSMLPFIANSFSKANLSRSMPYNFNSIKDDGYDYVVLEIAERNLDNVISSAPYMEACEADTDKSALIKLNADEYELRREEGELDLICGVVLKDIPTKAKIYVAVGDKLYEAFPCRDYSAVEGAPEKGDYFSLYAANGDDDITVYYTEF